MLDARPTWTQHGGVSMGESVASRKKVLSAEKAEHISVTGSGIFLKIDGDGFSNICGDGFNKLREMT